MSLGEPDVNRGYGQQRRYLFGTDPPGQLFAPLRRHCCSGYGYPAELDRSQDDRRVSMQMRTPGSQPCVPVRLSSNSAGALTYEISPNGVQPIPKNLRVLKLTACQLSR
jgi:hypothetical protein